MERYIHIVSAVVACSRSVFALLTASEYRSWVFYFSLPILDGILPEPYFSHYALLVAAIHILFGDEIQSAALTRADLYLRRFYEVFASLYGQYKFLNCCVPVTDVICYYVR